jgi:hypothetical protein
MQSLSIGWFSVVEIVQNVLKNWQWRRKDNVIWRKIAQMAVGAFCIFQSIGFGEW